MDEQDFTNPKLSKLDHILKLVLCYNYENDNFQALYTIYSKSVIVSVCSSVLKIHHDVTEMQFWLCFSKFNCNKEKHEDCLVHIMSKTLYHFHKALERVCKYFFAYFSNEAYNCKYGQ